MRACKFMIIDYIKTKQQMYLMPIFALAAILIFVKDFSIIVAFSYMVFIAITFSTTPFGACRAKDVGFLLLLPSTVRDRVIGRFLYGMSFTALAALFGGACLLIHSLEGKETESWVPAAMLLLLAVCIIMIALEYLISYLLGEHMASYLVNVIRVVPGMAVFFGSMMVIDNMGAGNAAFASFDIAQLAGNEAGGELMKAALGALLVSLAVLAAAAAVCIKVTEKRDYV